MRTSEGRRVMEHCCQLPALHSLPSFLPYPHPPSSPGLRSPLFSVSDLISGRLFNQCALLFLVEPCLALSTGRQSSSRTRKSCTRHTVAVFSLLSPLAKSTSARDAPVHTLCSLPLLSEIYCPSLIFLAFSRFSALYNVWLLVFRLLRSAASFCLNEH